MAIAYVNAVGGQDELVFDGSSMVLDAHGEVIATGPQFRDDLVILDAELDEAAQSRLHDPRRRAALRHGDSLEEVEQIDLAIDLDLNAPKEPSRPMVVPLSDEAEVWEALVLGTRDYLAKTSFERAYIGLSGGIDSSVVAAVAVDAIGPDNVHCVMMPSTYTSR